MKEEGERDFDHFFTLGVAMSFSVESSEAVSDGSIKTFDAMCFCFCNDMFS